MKLISQGVGDLSTNFDNADESEERIKNSSEKQTLIKNHKEANRGFKRKNIPLEYIFHFCKSPKKNNEGP